MFLYLQVYCLLTDSIWWSSNAQNDRIGRFKGKTEADRTDGLTLADSQKNTVMSVAFRYTVLERDSTAWLRIILPLGKMLDLLFLMIPSTLNPSLCYFSVVFGNIDLLNNKSGISISASGIDCSSAGLVYPFLSQWDTAMRDIQNGAF